jgi:hypothetical protein
MPLWVSHMDSKCVKSKNLYKNWVLRCPNFSKNQQFSWKNRVKGSTLNQFWSWLYDFLEPPTKCWKQIFEFENHQLRVCDIYPSLACQVQVPNFLTYQYWFFSSTNPAIIKNHGYQSSHKEPSRKPKSKCL